MTSTVLRSSMVTVPPSLLTDETTPPGMFSAVRIVAGSPITVIVYGPVNRRPSTITPLSAEGDASTK